MDAKEEVKEELLTIAETAMRLSLTDDAIRKAIARGKLQAIEKYGRLLIKSTDADLYKTTVKMGRPRKQVQSE